MAVLCAMKLCLITPDWGIAPEFITILDKTLYYWRRFIGRFCREEGMTERDLQIMAGATGL